MPDRPHYQRHHFIHEVLVSGYDTEDRTFVLSGFDEQGGYAVSRVPFAVLERACSFTREGHIQQALQAGQPLPSEFSHRIVDYPLTPLGWRQARCTAAYLAPFPIAAVYASPLQRARQTAACIAEPHRLPVQIIESFREVDVGHLEREVPTKAAWALHKYWAYRAHLDALADSNLEP